MPSVSCLLCSVIVSYVSVCVIEMDNDNENGNRNSTHTGLQRDVNTSTGSFLFLISSLSRKKRQTRKVNDGKGHADNVLGV